MITGKQPFKLLSIASEPAGLQFRAVPELVKKVHLVPVTITAPQQAGELVYSITIETDLPEGGKTTCQARATIGGGAPSEARAASPASPR